MLNTVATKKEKLDIYKEVTTRIITRLAKGEIPWRDRWCAPVNENQTANYVTGKPYSLLNRMLLGQPGRYIGFNQASKLGATVKKGAKSRVVVYYGTFIPKENKELAKELEAKGESIEHLKVPVLKYNRVFHVDDIEGLPEQKTVQPFTQAQNPTDTADYVIDDYCGRTGARVIEQSGLEPGYDLENDTVTVPERKQFHTEESFYNTLFGQMVRSTSTESRCNRKAAREDYTKGEDSIKEELVCEIGGSMCMCGVNLDNVESKEDTAAVCKKWIDALNHDMRLIVSASGAAEKAAKLILKPILDTES